MELLVAILINFVAGFAVGWAAIHVMKKVEEPYDGGKDE